MIHSLLSSKHSIRPIKISNKFQNMTLMQNVEKGRIHNRQLEGMFTGKKTVKREKVRVWSSHTTLGRSVMNSWFVPTLTLAEAEQLLVVWLWTLGSCKTVHSWSISDELLVRHSPSNPSNYSDTVHLIFNLLPRNGRKM